MKHLICIFSFLFFFGTSFAGIPLDQNYRSHKVQSGETVTSIAQKYAISEAAILRLNPDARKGVSSSTLLIIPSEGEDMSVQQEVKFKKHRVRRKETLFSIAKKYGITVDDIKKYNKHLYSKELRKGEKIQIPIFSAPRTTTVISTTDPIDVNNNTGSKTTDKTQIHRIEAKETKYGIARKYGITIAELEALNPNVPEGFPIGTELIVPTESVIDSAAIEEETFDFYEVLPKEGFYRLKVKLGLSQEEIIALNPYAKDGLKEGMILKIPKNEEEGLLANANKVDLEETITNTELKRIALMLPFRLQQMDTDSTELNEDLIKSNRTTRIALDFYSGVLMAAEFAKEKGISLELNVFDTEGSESQVSSIISENDFNEVDAVIGPLLSKNVQKAASVLKSESIPVFSPLSNRNLQLTSNLFQTLPSDDLLERSMIDYLKEHSDGKKIVLISDKKKAKQKAAILAALPDATVLEPREKGFLYVVDIQNKMDNAKENWVILESSDPVIVSNVVGLLNGMPENLKIRLFTTDKGEVYDFEDISNMHLAHLNFTFPSVRKSYDYDKKNAFLVSYKNKYDVLPNRFAVRGFDVAYDIILRLASQGDVYEASNSDFETEYIENKFRYKKKMFSGYTNNAFYILKYTEDLQFEVLR